METAITFTVVITPLCDSFCSISSKVVVKKGLKLIAARRVEMS